MGKIDHGPAPWLPFLFPMMNLPSELTMKTATPTLGSAMIVIVNYEMGSEDMIAQRCRS